MSGVNKLLDKLSKQTVICAEGYLFELERRGWMKIGPFVPEVVLSNPDAVKQLHREFVRCGSDVIQCLQYYGNRAKMKLIGKEDETILLNKRAIEIAFEVKNEFEYSDQLLVAGNVSQSTVYEANNEAVKREIFDMFCEQVQLCKEYNVDYMIGETFEYLGDALIALEVMKKFELPSVITFASLNEQTFDGYELHEACNILYENGCNVVGLNCSRGPETLLPLLNNIVTHYPNIKNIAALPVCYKTNPQYPLMQSFGALNEKYLELDQYTCTRNDMAQFALECVNLGINYIGTCCGGAPHHVRAMSEVLGRTTEASKYSPNLGQHYFFGNKSEARLNDTVAKHFGNE